MKLQLLFVFINFFVTSVFGQVIVSTKLIDHTTKGPIANANISLLSNRLIGTNSNNSGYFELRIPEISKTDKLIITCVGYEKKVVTINYIIWNSVIELVPKVERIDEVIITNNLTAKKVVKIAVRKFQKNYNRRFYSADFSLKSYLFIDSTKKIVGVKKIKGVVNTSGVGWGFVNDRLKLQQYQTNEKDDSICYFSILVNNYYDYLKFDLVRASLFKPDSSLLRIIFFTQPFFESCHFNFEKTAVYNNKEIFVISANKFRFIDYDYKLPEEVFRKKYHKKLEEYKENIKYSPTNKLFICTESQFDSIFYTRLRKGMEDGDMGPISMLLYIDKKNYAVLMVQYKMSIFPNRRNFYHENVSVTYEEKNGKQFLSNVEIVTKSKNCDYYSYSSIDFCNNKFGKELNRINPKEVFDMKRPTSIPSIDLINIDIGDWNRIKDTDILKPILRQNN